MDIILYKNCKLSNEYREVYYMKTGNDALQKYLNTLTSISFNLQDVYIKEQGILNIPMSMNTMFPPMEYNNILEFNYIQMIDGKIKRFYFIDNMDLINGIAVISYSIDVWHSYSKSIKINREYLVIR